MNKTFYNIALIAASSVFAFMMIFSLFVERDMWWDSSVYLGMGKYLYSDGSSGLWEPSRPIIWPLVLGFFWKIGLDAILFGRIAVIMLATGSLIAMYFLAKDIFGKETAIFSTIIFAFTPTFLLFSGILYTEIPSLFFLLMGLCMLFRKRPLISGLLMGLASMIRFYNSFFALAVILILFFDGRKTRVKNVVKFAAGFLIPIAPYIVSNLIIYHDAFYPFRLQAFMTINTGWVYHHGFSYYFVSLFSESFLILFSIIGIYFVARKGTSNQKKAAFIVVLPFLFYLFEKHKETRFMLPLLPIIYMLTIYGIIEALKHFKNKKAIIGALAIIWLAQASHFRFDRYDDKLDPFYSYIGNSKIKNGIWISNPSFITNSDLKADELIYYPLYGSNKSNELKIKLPEAQNVLINTCDILPCHPSDMGCSNATSSLILELSKKMTKVIDQKHGECRYLIYERIIS